MTTSHNYTRRLFLPLGLSLLLLLAALTLSSSLSLHKLHRIEVAADLKGFVHSLEKTYTREAHLLTALIEEQVINDPLLRQSWLLGDRQALLGVATPLLANLKENFDVTHFYFHDPEGINFLRVHKASKFGDRIDRYTMRTAMATGRTASGAELGPLGTFTLRVVSPWVIGGEVRGYVELGIDLGSIIKQIRHELNTEIIFFIKKEFLDRQAWEEGQLAFGRDYDWNLLPDYVPGDMTVEKIPPDISSTLSSSEAKQKIFLDISLHGRKYEGGYAPLTDPTGREVGVIVLLKDTEHKNALARQAWYRNLFAAFAFALLFFCGAMLYVRKTTSRLEEGEAALKEEERNRRQLSEEKIELEELNRKLQDELVERSKLEAALRTSETTLKTMMKAAENVAFVMADKRENDARILEMSPGAELIFGYRREELLGRPVAVLHLPENVEKIAAYRENVQESGKSFSGEISLRRKSGEAFPAIVTIHPVYDETGRISATIGVVIDVSELEEAKRARAESEKLYRLLIDAITDVFFIVTPDWHQVEYVSPAYERIWGRSRDELQNNSMAWLDSIWEEDRPGIVDFIENMDAEQETSWTFPVVRVRRTDGTTSWVQGRAFPIHDDKGRVSHLAGMAKDVTQQVLSEQALQRSEELYRSVFNSSRDFIFLVEYRQDGRFGRFLEANDVACEKLGYTKEELQQLTPMDVDAGNSEQEISEIHQTIKTHDSYVFTTYLQPKYAERIPVEIRVQPCHFGQTRAIMAVARDISERKKALEEQQKQAAVIENSSDFIGIATLDGKVLYVNSAGLQLVGLDSLAEARTKHIRDFYSPEDYAFWKKNYDPVIREEGRCSFEANMRHFKTQEPIPLDHNSFIIKDPESGVPLFHATVSRDLTERKRAEESLRQAQKMEAIGTLAGGIAHDFNNILSGIIGYTEFSMLRLNEDDPIYANLAQILKAGDRAAGLVRQILDFSRQREGESLVVKVQSVAGEALKLLRGSLPATIAIQGRIDPDCPAILADPIHIHQIIMNLCTNAYHAMREKGGVLTLSLEPLMLEPQDAKRDFRLEPGRYIKLSVSDTGCGIARENMERIFEPYFTTKEMERGTGLGLAVVHGLVKQYNGTISTSSRMGEGTTFEVVLPAFEQPRDTADELETGVHDLSTARFTGKVLLVDDEEIVVRVEKEILTSLGCTVEDYVDSREAFAAFAADPHAFDAVFTDQTMPGMTGRELAARILAIRPDIPIVLATGHSDTVTAEEAERIGISKFALKPLTLKTIKELLVTILPYESGELSVN